MANGKVHKIVGISAGGGLAYLSTSDMQAADRILEMLGGCFGGALGGKAPDWIDPPTNPNHRSVGHGVIPVASIAKWYFENLPKWQATCRAAAEQHSQLRQQSQTNLHSAWHGLMEILFRLIAGFLAGLPAGYLSHVGLDAVTPKSLPFVY